ncbi:MAG: tyrosine-type recombinase/integrase [Candidatus Xenobiia bacterium LiM19]
MRIYKRKDRPYYFIDYINSAGERVRESTGTSNKKTAEEILAKRKEDVRTGRFGMERPEQITFEKLCDRFFKSAIKLKPSTRMRYQTSTNQLLPYFREHTIDKIAVYDIEKYQQDRIKKRKAATVNRDMAFLRRLFNKAKKWKLITKNPIDDIDFLEENNTRTRFYTVEEVPRLLEQCRHLPYLYQAVMIALHTGMRKREILSLWIPREGENLDKENWIDMENRCLHLNVTKNKKYRQVPLNKTIYSLLKVAIKDKEPGPLFTIYEIRKSFTNALKRAKIENACFHDLRRTFISHAMMAGYSQEIIQRVVGQDDPTIFRRYAHLTPDLKNSVVNDIGRIFSQESPQECTFTINPGIFGTKMAPYIFKFQ